MIVAESAVTVKALAIKPIIMWPALILATSRSVRVKGRIKSLTVSIRTRRGTSGPGAPAGAKCAADSIGNLIHPERTINVQNTRAIEAAIQMFLVAP